MKVELNLKEITLEEAYDKIRDLIPNGGTQFLDNLIANCRENETDCITLRVGNKDTLTIEF